MSIPRVQDVLQTIQVAVANAINANSALGIGIGQVVVGWPNAADLTQILAQAGEQWQCTVHDRGAAKNVTRYEPMIVQIGAPYESLQVAVSGSTITFSGVVSGGCNVYAFVGTPLRAAHYEAPATTVSGSASIVAAGLIAAINALAIPGVVATASGSTALTVTGSPTLRCTIAGYGMINAEEVGRVERSVHIVLWVPDPYIRWILADIALQNIGTIDPPFLTLSDGSSVRVRYATDYMIDKSQSSYSLYEHHIVVMCEYGLIRNLTGYQIGAITANETVTAGNRPTQTKTQIIP